MSLGRKTEKIIIVNKILNHVKLKIDDDVRGKDKQTESAFFHQ